MNATLKKIWRTTTENAIWIFYTMNTLFSVSDAILVYITLITLIGIIFYYANALVTLSINTNQTNTRDSWTVFAYKLWRITQANGLRLTMSISAVFYLDGQLFWNALVMTLISFILFYTYAYETTHIQQAPPAQPFAWRTFWQTMWNITASHILTIIGAISLFLFVTDYTLPSTALCVGIGMVLFYWHAYVMFDKDSEE